MSSPCYRRVHDNGEAHSGSIRQNPTLSDTFLKRHHDRPDGLTSLGLLRIAIAQLPSLEGHAGVAGGEPIFGAGSNERCPQASFGAGRSVGGAAGAFGRVTVLS